MPQIGWFEILIIVVLALLIIGPKDFPIMIKKIGNWIGTVKRYFSDIQKSVTDIESVTETENAFEKNLSDKIKEVNKDER